MSIEERAKILRKKLGLSQAVFAKQIKISQSTLADAELPTKSTKLKQIYIDEIVRVFKINKDWLLNGQGEMFNNNGNTTSNCANDQLLSNVNNENHYGVPVVKNIYTYFNNTSVFNKDNVIFYVDSTLLQSIIKDPVKSSYLVGFELENNLHYPRFERGCYVIVNTLERELILEKTYLVRFDDQLILKKVQLSSDGIVLVDTNPDDYKLKPDQVEILGRVCYSIRED